MFASCVVKLTMDSHNNSWCKNIRRVIYNQMETFTLILFLNKKIGCYILSIKINATLKILLVIFRILKKNKLSYPPDLSFFRFYKKFLFIKWSYVEQSNGCLFRYYLKT